jgi:methylenetetrahydrofolate reductase (NADPH)
MIKIKKVRIALAGRILRRTVPPGVGHFPSFLPIYFVGYNKISNLLQIQPGEMKPGRNMSHARTLASASVEISARGNHVAELIECCQPGTEAFLTWLPGDDPARQVAVAASIARAGFHPVPHVAARSFATNQALDDFLTRAVGEAGVSRLLLIAGDQQQARGPFASSLQVLATGLLQKHGIGLVYVAGHPEGHPRVAREIMHDALKQKLAWGRDNGMAMRVVTQFCFEPEPVVEWLQRFEREFDAPVHIGLAGPATPATLLKFALRCGVGNSVRALQSQAARFTRLLVETAPDALVDGLITAASEGRIRTLPGFHVFPFGGLRATARWIGSRQEKDAAVDRIRASHNR